MANRLLSIFVAAMALTTSVAAAQPLEETVVLPIVTGGGAAEYELAEQLESQLAESRLSLISMHDARDRFVSRSRAAQSPSENDLEALAESAQQASEQVAFGRTAAAERSVRDVLSRAEKTLETLNRETTQARTVLDACLALVRSALQEGKRDAALSQAMRCRRLVPDLSPSSSAHPATVVGVLAEADNLLRRMRTGKLTVVSTPDEGCSVYMNGRHLGSTPFEIDHAAVGDYRVQVECDGQPGRVHFVHLGDQPAELEVDTGLERMVRTEPRLSLHYESVEQAHAQMRGHAAKVGAAIDAADVVLVEVESGMLALTRVRASSGRVVARTSRRYAGKRARLNLQDAIVALNEGRVVPDATEPQAVAEATPTPVLPELPAEAPLEAQPATVPELANPSGWKPILSGTALAFGAASLVTAGVFTIKRRHHGDSLRNASPMQADYVFTAERWQDSRAKPYAFAAAGAVVATAGVVGLVTGGERPPPQWVSAVVGTAGVALAAWGLADIARGSSCDGSAPALAGCHRGLEVRDRGAITLMAGLPLLAAPVAAVIRRALLTSDVRSSTFALNPDVDLPHRTFALNASVRWH